jgi:ABC-type bacteriocin/lantibiotic exporter with double-glycine peptidase domain
LLFTALVVPILWLSSLVLGGLVLAAVFQLAHLWTVEQVQRRVVVNVLAELAWRLPRVRLEALLSEHGPRLGNRFLDVVVVQKAVATLLVDGVNGLVAAVAGTVLLALYHPYLLGFALTLWTVVVCFLWATGPRAVRTAIAESYAKHEAASLVEELVAHPLAARGQGGAAWAVARADQLAHRYLEARGAHFRAWFLQAGFLLAAYSVASAALLSVGGALVVAGQLSIGQLIAAELVLGAVLGSLSKLGKQLEKVYDLLAGMDKLGHLLDLPVVPSGAERLSPDAAGAELRIDGLQWIHEDGDVLLNGLSCTIPAGATVAVSGPAGAGKRTLLELLAGLRHPSSGHVYADGVDVMALDEDTRTGAVVLAEGTDVVEGSVLENVHMGRVGVSDEDARAALATVGLLEAVERLPDGVRTRVGTRGWPLSRSQARRLTLARALAGKPRVLLVDGDVEPTLFARLVAPGRTLLAVANDPRAWSSCSHRLHLEGGTANLEVLR